MRKSRRKRAKLRVESLEARLCLTSVGWDGVGLGSASLNYYVGDVPAGFDLDQAEVALAIEQAIDVWSDVVDVTFVETSIPNLRDSIDIEFTSIDGRGGTLAQAYLPDDVNRGRMAGDIEIDISEAWELGNSLGRAAFDLTWVMVHELGHSLGIEHVNSFGSVLYPSVSPNQAFNALSPEDVDAALALYAAADSTSAANPADPPVDDAAAESPAEEESPTPTDEETDVPTRRGPWARWRVWFGGWRVPIGRTAHIHVETLTAFHSRFHNASRAADVNGDKAVSAIDALHIINDLNLNGARELIQAEGEISSLVSMVDVNGDSRLSAIDALQVINELNDEPADVPEASNSEEIDAPIDPAEDEPLHDEMAEDEAGSETPGDDQLPAGESSSGEETDEPSNEGEMGDEAPIDDGPLEEEDCPRGHLLFARFDGNEDGALTEDEVPDRLWDRLSSADGNGDGAVTSEELAGADFGHTRRHDRFGHQHGERSNRLARLDGNEDNALTADEVPERLWNRISAADLNEDGAVTLDELAGYRDSRKAERESGELGD